MVHDNSIGDEFTSMTSPERSDLGYFAIFYIAFSVLCFFALAFTKMYKTLNALFTLLAISRITMSVTLVLQAFCGDFANVGIIYDVSSVLSQYIYILNILEVCQLLRAVTHVYRGNALEIAGMRKKWPVVVVMIMPLAYIICKLCSYLKPTDLSNEMTRIFYKL